MSPPRTWTLEVPSNFRWMTMNVKPDGTVESLRLDHQTHAFAANSPRPCKHERSHAMHQETWEFPVTLQCLKILTLLAKQHVPTLTDVWNGLGIELCRTRRFEVRLLQRARMEYFELQSTVQKHCNKKTATCNLHAPGLDVRNCIQSFLTAPGMPSLHIPRNWIKVAGNGWKWMILAQTVCNECHPYKRHSDYNQTNRHFLKINN